ncbi:MAG TPA: hypothetical protein VMW52_13435, partial [Phycisphaerae bacterium]|nr:hypothetical protein [Phycisphaerae bacterium]
KTALGAALGEKLWVGSSPWCVPHPDWTEEVQARYRYYTRAEVLAFSDWLVEVNPEGVVLAVVPRRESQWRQIEGKTAGEVLKCLGMPRETVVTLGQISQEEVVGLMNQPVEKHFFFNGGAKLVVDEEGMVLEAKRGERREVDWESVKGGNQGEKALKAFGIPQHVEVHLDPCMVADEVMEAWLAKPLKKRLCYMDVQMDVDPAGIVASVGPDNPSSPTWRGYEEWDRRHQ